MSVFAVPDLNRAIMNCLPDIRILQINSALDKLVREHPEYARWTKIHNWRNIYTYGLPKMIDGYHGDASRYPTINDSAPVSERMISGAFAKGNMPMIEHLMDLGVAPEMFNLAEICASAGQLTALKYVISRGYPVKDAMGFAAIRGRLSIVEYLYCLDKNIYYPNVIKVAIMSSHINVVKFLIGAGVDLAPINNWIHAACFYNRAKILKYLLGLRVAVVDNHALFNACAAGNVGIVKVLAPRENFTDGLVAASKLGHIGVVRYLFKRGPIDVEIALLAACECDRVAIVKYFTHQGVIRADSLEHAALHGSLGVVKYLTATSAVNIAGAILAAKLRGQSAVVEYLSAL